MIRALLLIAAILAATLGWILWRAERAEHRADMADIAAEQAVSALARANDIIDTERERAAQLAAIAEQYERDKADAQAAADAVVAELRDGTVRLRQHWQGCEATARVSADATAAALADAAAELRRKGAGDLVSIGDACDAHVRGLQRVIGASR